MDHQQGCAEAAASETGTGHPTEIPVSSNAAGARYDPPHMY